MSASRTLLLALLALAVTAGPARAGEYTVTACPSPAGVQPPAGGWVFDAGGTTALPVTQCHNGAALGIWLQGTQPAQHTARWTFDPPPDLPVVGYRIARRWHVNGQPNNTGSSWLYTYYVSEWNAAGTPTGAESCTVVQCPAPGPAGGPDQAPLVRGPILADRVELAIQCGYAPSDCPPVDADPLGGASLTAGSVEMTLRDSAVPKFTAGPEGSLLAGGVQTGVRDVRVQATDAGGGLWRAAIEVDGREVLSVPFDDRQGVCAQPFAQIQPCAASGDVTLRLDTASLPDGDHQVSVVVSDVTGTNRAVHGPVAVRTVNDPVSCAPGRPGAVLAGGLGRRGRARLLVGHGRSARLAGRLGDAAGAPVAAPVVVLERVARAGEAFAARPARVTPGRAGRMSLALPAGPSRDLRLGYRAAAGDSVLRCTRTFRLRVRARASLKAAPRTLAGSRRVVRLSGRLPRAFLPAGGKLVELQAFERGRWHTFRTVRTGARGRFTTRYRFGAATRGAFPMRARVRRDAAYPFEPARSKSVVVRVT